MIQAGMPHSTIAPGLNRRAHENAAASVPLKAFAVTVSRPSRELVAYREAHRLYWTAALAMAHAIRDFASQFRLDSPSWREPMGVLSTPDLDPLLLNEPAFVEACEEDRTVCAARAHADVLRGELDLAIGVLLRRTVKTPADVAELAELWWAENRWCPSVIPEGDTSGPSPIDAVLHAAIMALAGEDA